MTTLEERTIIGIGARGIVYKISDDKAAKIKLTPRQVLFDREIDTAECEFLLRYEYNIAKKLYEKEISVPKPEEIILFKPRWRPDPNIMYDLRKLKQLPCEYTPDRGIIEGREMPALIMEYVKGPTLAQLTNNAELFEKATKSRDEEIKKARELGFDEFDAEYPGNTIWSQEKNKAVLIDFEMWVSLKL